jgi:acyl-CoA synthetase (AMP-forming)/AMP-acid ligase II
MQNQTLTSCLQFTAEKYPAHGIHYVHENGLEEIQTYADLLKEAYALAGGFLESGHKPGDKVIISTLLNRQTISAVWGCFFAGLVPTILQTPLSMNDKSQAAEKMQNVYNQLDYPDIIVSKIISSNSEIPEAKFKLFEDLPRVKSTLNFIPKGEDLAFIQFSSGSTGEPKGIMLTHTNLASNITSIIAGLELTAHDRGGNWMPLYHDMGLIGFHFTPLVTGTNQYHIETIDFIKNPSLWLDLLSNARISISGSPNFGQSLTLRHIQRKKQELTWDFSSVKALLNGAEPISVKIMDEFTKALERYGFPEHAMMPVYGMAEATLAISFSPLMQPSVTHMFDSSQLDLNGQAVIINSGSHKHVRQLTSVGMALNDIEIRVVNENSEVLPEANVGHIQVKGPAVTKGYYKNPRDTSLLFSDEWLRTGDLGFFLDKHLFISGRYKDIIFMNGKNYFANDLENLACSLDEISYGKVAFGGITDHKAGKDKIIIFAAGIPESKATETLQILRTLFRKTLGIPVDELVILRSNEFPKTSSGKIQRYKILQRYQQGDFSANRYK